MADWKKRRFSIITFIVLFSTWGLSVFYGYMYLIRGRVYLNVNRPVAELTKHSKALHKVPQMKGNISTIDQRCQLPEIKQYSQIQLQRPINRKYLLFNSTKVCYCLVPKAASTSLLRSLLVAEYPEKARYYETMAGSFIHGQPILGQSKSTSRTCSTGSDMSFFVTRDPYRRLFSAYIDKIFLEKFRSLAQKLNRSESNNSKQLLQNLNVSNDCDLTKVTLEQFLNHIEQLMTVDAHFSAITTLCDPCEHHYDLVLKNENIEEKKSVLLKYLNSRSRVPSREVTIQDYSGMDGLQRTATSYYSIAKTTRGCELTMDRQDAINRRLWDALKILGNIDERLQFNKTWFQIPLQTYNAVSIGKLLVKNLVDGGVQALDPTQRDKQRHKYLVQAYRSVNKNTIKQIQRLYKLDFMLFGYDIEPPE